MLNIPHLRMMHTAAKSFDLNIRDRVRWFWSYYASRLPRGRSLSGQTLQLTIRNTPKPTLRVLIRANGWDWRIIYEIFGLNAYRVDLDNVSRILDLGGNIGLAALFFARVYPSASIYTVEPIPDNLGLLHMNLQLNPSQVKVLSVAVGAQDGKAHFQISEDPGGHSSLGDRMHMLPTGENIDVDVLSVPSILRQIGWEDVDLLKIDIEGSEIDVLSGRPDWLKKVRCIIGEGHIGVGYTIEKCRQDLEPMGFDVELIDQKEYSILFVARRVN